jgi:hypothetical protein
LISVEQYFIIGTVIGWLTVVWATHCHPEGKTNPIRVFFKGFFLWPFHLSLFALYLVCKIFCLILDGIVYCLRLYVSYRVRRHNEEIMREILSGGI